MSVTSGFFNSLSGDRKYDALQISSMFDGLITDGIYNGYLKTFMVSASEPASMDVKVGEGRAWFNHTWTLNDTPLPLTVEKSDVVLNRIDTVVIDVDLTDETRACTIKIVKGTPASQAVPPTLVKELKHHQYPLCDISVPVNASTITQAQIKNRRGTSDCPFVATLMKSVNIDDLLVQWEAQWDEWMLARMTAMEQWTEEQKQAFLTWTTTKKEEFEKWSQEHKAGVDHWTAEQKEAFNAWFTTVQDILDTDTAGKLLNRINHRTGANSTAVYDMNVVKITAPDDAGEILTFIAPSDFKVDDTYTLNDTPITITDLNGDPIEYAWKKDSVVTITVNGNKAFFKSGGGVNQTLPLLLPNFKVDWYDDHTVIVIADMVPAAENPNLAGAKFVYSKDGLAFPNSPVDGISVDIPIDELVY